MKCMKEFISLSASALEPCLDPGVCTSVTNSVLAFLNVKGEIITVERFHWWQHTDHLLFIDFACISFNVR